MMLTKVTLVRVPAKSVLFIESDEAAVIVNGQLLLFSHEEDVGCPCLQAIYNSGDILGLPSIDNGWSVAQHSWICSEEDCDVFMLS